MHRLVLQLLLDFHRSRLQEDHMALRYVVLTACKVRTLGSMWLIYLQSEDLFLMLLSFSFTAVLRNTVWRDGDDGWHCTATRRGSALPPTICPGCGAMSVDENEDVA